MALAAEPADSGTARIAALADAARARRVRALAALGGGTAALFAAALLIGPVAVSPGEVLAGLAGALGLAAADGAAAIVAEIRAPRALLGLAVGAVLGLAGAALQGLFRNPLVDPGLIGVSAGGALGAATWIVFGAGVAGLLGVFSAWALTLSAFAGALAAMAAVYAVGRYAGAMSVATLLLAGIAINALAAAGLGVLTVISTDAQLRTMTFWSMGSLGGAGWSLITPALILMALAGVALLREARALDLFTLGEREARHLGLDTDALKTRIVLAAALGAGAAVAVSGIIGFVGLVAPHLVRLMLGTEHRAVLPASALLGAALVLGADLIARMAIAPAELPIGIVTSLIGAPVFIWLLMRTGARAGERS